MSFDALEVLIVSVFVARVRIATYTRTVVCPAQRHLIGLARDLRGVAFAFNTKISYMMLFDWLYP